MRSIGSVGAGVGDEVAGVGAAVVGAGVGVSGDGAGVGAALVYGDGFGPRIRGFQPKFFWRLGEASIVSFPRTPRGKLRMSKMDKNTRVYPKI